MELASCALILSDLWDVNTSAGSRVWWVSVQPDTDYVRAKKQNHQHLETSLPPKKKNLSIKIKIFH